MKRNKDEDNLHKEHRQRVRKRFLDGGMQNFQDHEILEMLLFYSIPQGDTNETAHRLLNRYGSLSAVFDAEYDSLLGCNGIGEISATLLKMIVPLARAYLMDRETRYPDFADLSKLGGYLVNYYIGCVREKVIAVLLNSRMEMIDIITAGEGTVISSDSSARRIAEIGLSKSASFIVLAHNHPGGIAAPSKEDIALTEEYAALFHKLGMPLIEHFIVAGSEYCTVCSFVSGKNTF